MARDIERRMHEIMAGSLGVVGVIVSGVFLAFLATMADLLTESVLWTVLRGGLIGGAPALIVFVATAFLLMWHLTAGMARVMCVAACVYGVVALALTVKIFTQ